MVSVSVEDAQAQLIERIMTLPGVTGVAIGERSGRPCILVYVVIRTSLLDKEIPASFRGYEVVVKESGEIPALHNDG